MCDLRPPGSPRAGFLFWEEQLAVNNLTEFEAQKLRARIERYWRARGYDGIKTRWEYMSRHDVAPEEKTGSLDWWAVRSNIGPSGFPPRKREQLAA
jgi:hypothetical protein